MRINQYIAQATGLSRRAADHVIGQGRVTINQQLASLGSQVTATDQVKLDGQAVTLAANTLTIMLNKPVGYVCSRDGQGSPTIYDLLPPQFGSLKPIGRLDKDSSGLLLLTNDGQLANRLAHPRYGKEKVYEVTLDKPLDPANQKKIKQGIELDDGISRLQVESSGKNQESRLTARKSPDSCSLIHDTAYEVRMTEGRNRQIRRTFAALGYEVIKLHRISLGDYRLGNLPPGQYQPIKH